MNPAFVQATPWILHQWQKFEDSHLLGCTVNDMGLVLLQSVLS